MKAESTIIQRGYIPKNGDPIYYKDGEGRTIPGVVCHVYWIREGEVWDFPPLVAVRLNHPDHARDITRIVKYKNIEEQKP